MSICPRHRSLTHSQSSSLYGSYQGPVLWNDLVAKTRVEARLSRHWRHAKVYETLKPISMIRTRNTFIGDVEVPSFGAHWRKPIKNGRGAFPSNKGGRQEAHAPQLTREYPPVYWEFDRKTVWRECLGQGVARGWGLSKLWIVLISTSSTFIIGIFTAHFSFSAPKRIHTSVVWIHAPLIVTQELCVTK